MIGKLYFVRCDNCGAHSASAPTPELALDGAKSDGWVQQRLAGLRKDLCPQCRRQGGLAREQGRGGRNYRG